MIYILKDGSPSEPFSIDALSKEIRAGRLSLSALAWHEGLPAWTELRNIPGMLSAAMPPPPVESKQSQSETPPPLPTLPPQLTPLLQAQSQAPVQPSRQTTAGGSRTAAASRSVPPSSSAAVPVVQSGRLRARDYVLLGVGLILMLIVMVAYCGVAGFWFTLAVLVVVAMVIGGFILRDARPKIAGGIVIATGILFLVCGVLSLLFLSSLLGMMLMGQAGMVILWGQRLRNRDKVTPP